MEGEWYQTYIQGHQWLLDVGEWVRPDNMFDCWLRASPQYCRPCLRPRVKERGRPAQDYLSFLQLTMWGTKSVRKCVVAVHYFWLNNSGLVPIKMCQFGCDDFISWEGEEQQEWLVEKEKGMEEIGGGEGGRQGRLERERDRETWQAEWNTLTPRHARPRDTGTSQLVCVREMKLLPPAG